MPREVQIVAMALDESPLATGWACGAPNDPRPRHGLFRLPTWGDDEGARLCEFEDWLIGSIKSFGVTHLFYESPVDVKYGFGRRPKSFTVTSKQSMQIGAINMAGWRCNKTPVAQVPVDSWRSRFLGQTKVPGLHGEALRQELKLMAIKACALRGWIINDDNVAEAHGILDFGLSTLSRSHAGGRDIIFRRAELKAWQGAAG